MDKKLFRASGRAIVLFTGQLVILIFCIWYVEFIYYANIYPDKVVSSIYNITTCTLDNKGLSEHKGLTHRYRADFLLSYYVDGVAYSQAASGNGLDRSFTTDRASQEKVLTEFTVGNRYNCWYSPSDPQLVVLVLRDNWASTFPLFIPSVIGLIMIYYILRSVFLAIGQWILLMKKKGS